MLDPGISKMLITFVLINCLYASMDQLLDIREKDHKAKHCPSTSTYPKWVSRHFFQVRLYFQHSLEFNRANVAGGSCLIEFERIQFMYGPYGPYLNCVPSILHGPYDTYVERTVHIWGACAPDIIWTVRSLLKSFLLSRTFGENTFWEHVPGKMDIVILEII